MDFNKVSQLCIPIDIRLSGKDHSKTHITQDTLPILHFHTAAPSMFAIKLVSYIVLFKTLT